MIQPVNILTSPSYSLIRVLYGDNHACLHTLKMLFILLLISKRSTKSSHCRSGATLSVKSEAKNSQNKASMSLFLATGCGKEGQSNHQSVCRTKHGLLQNMQNGTCKCFSVNFEEPYSKLRCHVDHKLVGVARILCLLLRSRRDLTFYTCK